MQMDFKRAVVRSNEQRSVKTSNNSSAVGFLVLGFAGNEGRPEFSLVSITQKAADVISQTRAEKQIGGKFDFVLFY